MTKNRKHEVPDAIAAGIGMQEAWPPVNGPMVTALIRFGQSYNEGLSLLGQEMLDFSRTRLSRDTATALSIAQCKDWSEATKIQQDWARTATEEYAAEMGKLFQLAVKATMESYRPLQDQARGGWGGSNGGG